MANPDLMVLSEDERAAVECWRRQTGRGQPMSTDDVSARPPAVNPVVARLDAIHSVLSELAADVRTLILRLESS